MKSLRLLLCSAATLALVGVAAPATADGDAFVVTKGQDRAPGVSATAFEYLPAKRLTNWRGADTPSAQYSSVTKAVSQRVVVAVQPHTCAPVYGTGGIPVSYSFSPVASGDCVSFTAPPPVRPGPRPGPGPRRRPRPSPETLARIAADEAMSLASEPELEVAPGAVGLTGLDSYFWLAEPPQPIEAIAQVPGLQVTAEARPVQFVWDFGDGSDHVTDHPGRAWRPETAGTVAHLFERRGNYDLGVEVIWEARWRLGDAAWQHLGYFSNSDATSYPVRQMVPVLTRTPR